MQDAMFAPMGAMHIQYEIDGHLYTTFVVARLAGWTVPRALELAWGSQVPDANRKFTAVSAAWDALWNKHSRALMEVLHSLHGGKAAAVRKRRADLKSLVAKCVAAGIDDAKVGLIVHAFGDSYAHTQGKGDDEKAFGVPVGHGHEGHVPDKIGEFPDKYLAYIDALYRSLGGTGDPQQVLARARQIVADNAGSNSAISAGIVNYAAELGMREEESDAVKDKLLARITEADVTRTMDEMRAYFAG